MTTSIQRLRDALDAAGCSVRGSGDTFSAQCPAHDDGAPSLSVSYTDGKTLLNCHAGCQTGDVLDELGLRSADLFDADAERKPECDHGRPWRSCELVTRYFYTDADGRPVYVQRRYRCRACGAKTFMPLNPATDKAGLPKGVRVLYRLPEVTAAARAGRTVFVVEGEKDADRLFAAGYVATTAVNGAEAKWEQTYTDALVGAEVVVIADNDEPGHTKARAVAGTLSAAGIQARAVRSPLTREHSDVSDHLDAGYDVDALVELDAEPIGPSAPAARDEAEEGDDSGGKPPSQASRLVELARKRYELFMSEDGRPYGVKLDGPNIALPLRGKAGLRSQLARIYTDASNGAVPSQAALADAMTVLEGIAASEEPRVPHLRVARHGDEIVVDLGTTDGACVVIGPHGWRREPRSPVLFRRSGAMKPLPAPVSDGDGLARLRRLINTDEHGFRLLAAWMAAAFIPDLPHPILTFRGEQGTGKSYAAKMVIGIVDPSGAPKRTAPRDVKSWATQAFNSWALCLDNVSIVPDWLSDALCRAVTGDGIVDRALYTDDDVVVLEFRRVLAMTTIDAGALSGDLAERLLTIELNLIPDQKRREEGDLDAAFADAHAGILASLFDLLADVLKVLPDVELNERPRMADFARVLAAVDQVREWKTLETYKASARDAVADVLEGEPFAQAVVAMIRDSAPNEVIKTAKEILDAVKTPERLPKKWPKDATRAGGQLKRLAPALRTIGVEVDDSKRQEKGNRSRLYRITDLERSSKPAPAAPAAPGDGADQGKPAGAEEGASARATDYSTRATAAAGAAGAEAGAGNPPAPASDIQPELGEDPPAGAAGAAGANLRPLSNGTECAAPECTNPPRRACRTCADHMDKENAA